MKLLDQFIGRQIRKPSGLSGRLLGHLMANEHQALVDWMLEPLDIAPTDTVLDVGCGGGMTLKALSQIAHEGFVAGVDYAPTMVAQAKSRNKAAIAAGSMDVTFGDVKDLPFEDNRFAFVVGVETLYFWPEPIAGLKEILRVLKPGGTVAQVMDISKPSRDAPVPKDVGDRMGFHVYSAEELDEMFTEAGFESVRVEAKPERAKGWICAYGSKPGAP